MDFHNLFQVKVYKIQQNDNNESHPNILEKQQIHMPEIVQLVKFSKYTENTITTALSNQIHAVDYEYKKMIYSSPVYVDTVQTFSWNIPETQILLNTRDRVLQLADIRFPKPAIVVPSHQSIKNVKVVWLGENYVISSGKYDCSHFTVHFM